ncbi:MAG: PEP-CTERM sorting domain-containing protein [Chloroflexi bacterium]|nr:PEP-CTERM sorting domain-containing protein [Chloroflexota bacterium]
MNMNTRHKSAIRLAAAAVLSAPSFPVSAQITPPAWSSQEYLVYDYVEAFDVSPPINNDWIVNNTGALPIQQNDSSIGAKSSASIANRLSYKNGTYTARYSTLTTSAGSDQDTNPAYAHSYFSMDNRFQATAATPKLYFDYRYSGSISLSGTALPPNYNPKWAYVYHDPYSSFTLRDETARTQQVIQFFDIYEELTAPGSISYPLVGQASLIFDLKPGHQYRVWVDGYSDSFSSGTSTSGAAFDMVFSFSTTAPVPEPSEGAMLVLGLAGLAGWLRRRRPM